MLNKNDYISNFKEIEQSTYKAIELFDNLPIDNDQLQLRILAIILHLTKVRKIATTLILNISEETDANSQ